MKDIYPKLPEKKYQVIYADPPWDYGGKVQYDKSTIKDENVGFEKKIFLSSASFKYPTVKLKQLKELDVKSITDDDCILFMWTTGPQMDDFKREGTTLNHCVYTNYFEKAAKGLTSIFFIRQKENIEKPFFTLEIKDGHDIKKRNRYCCGRPEKDSDFLYRFRFQLDL